MKSQVVVWTVLAFAVSACGNDTDDTDGAGGQPPLSGGGGMQMGGSTGTGGGPGSTGAGDGTGTGGTGGGVTDVTVPTAGEYCTSGYYPGMYEGAFMGPALPEPFPIAGPFNIELEPVDAGACAADEEFCFSTIAEGSVLSISYAGVITVDAMLQGGVNCETGVFTASSSTSECSALVAGLPSGCSIEMQGMMDPVTKTVTGTFELPNDFGVSTGTFSVTLEP